MSTKITSYSTLTETFELPTPYKTGYNFIGWTGSNGSTPQKSVTVSKGSSGTKSYKANWEGITYTYVVAYKSTSGKSLGSTTVQGFLGDTKTVVLPAKTGYKTPDNVSVVFDTVGSKTVTVTYEPINYNISFIKNGGTYSEPAIQYNIESSEIVLGNAHKTGTGFLGWYDNSSFNGSRILSIPTGSTGDKTFYAKFSVDSYSITYYLDEGTMSGGLTTYTVNTTTFNLPTPTKTGYTFKGWTGTGLSGDTMTVTIPQGSTGDREYTAHWEVNEYTYTFRYLSSTGKQLGSTTITNQFREGEMVTPPDYAGYTTPAKQSVIWDSTTPKTIDFTYPINTYTITYYLDGGTASNLKTSYTVEDTNFALPTPTKEGFIFEGWYDNSSFTGTAVTSIPAGSYGNKTYYAKWSQIQASVNETWVINSTPQLYASLSMYHDYNIRFVSNGVEYDTFSFFGDLKAPGASLRYKSQSLGYPELVYDYIAFCPSTEGFFDTNGTWRNEAYRTIEFLEEPTGELLTWLQSNAVKQNSSQTANVISFTIVGTPYQAKEGMTWEEWVNSEYNTEGYIISGKRSNTTPICVWKSAKISEGYLSQGELINGGNYSDEVFAEDQIIADHIYSYTTWAD